MIQYLFDSIISFKQGQKCPHGKDLFASVQRAITRSQGCNSAHITNDPSAVFPRHLKHLQVHLDNSVSSSRRPFFGELSVCSASKDKKGSYMYVHVGACRQEAFIYFYTRRQIDFPTCTYTRPGNKMQAFLKKLDTGFLVSYMYTRTNPLLRNHSFIHERAPLAMLLCNPV